MMSGLMNVCRLRLGLKPIIDYAQSRRRLIGVADLNIKTVFDIGANVGKKAKLYRKLFPKAKILCVEPSTACCRRLSSWADGQQDRVEVFQMAMGSEPGQADFYFQEKHPGGSTIVAPRESLRDNFTLSQVRLETLDRLAESLLIEEEILVKIDVEGHDLEVIRGGTETLRRAAAVIVEIGLPQRPNGRPIFLDFASTLHDLGYMYRGNLAQGFVNGTARVADAVFVKSHQRRAAA